MGFLDNRHLKTALVVAPLLGVATYMVLDTTLAEQPAPARAGQSYPLAEGPSCRYASGFCSLKNGDVEVRVDAKRLSAAEVTLTLSSELPLSHALVAVGKDEHFEAPSAVEGDAQRSVRVAVTDAERTRLRWALTIADTTYYAETSAAFVDRERLVDETD